MPLTDIFTPGQRERGSNSYDGVLHTLQNWSLTTRCSLVSYPEYSFFGRSKSSAGDAVSVL